MASVVWEYTRTGIWRFSRRDAILVFLAGLHGLALAVWPTAPLIAVGVWWNANTIAHNFIHRPFFRSIGLNRMFSGALSILLGIPQTLWRDRHLAHHAGAEWRLRVSRQLSVEAALVVCLWTVLALPPKGVYHFDPRDAHQVGKLCAKHRVTVFMGTPTFLRIYLRRVKPDRGHPGVVRRISADGFTNPATGSTLRFGGGQLPRCCASLTRRVTAL